MSVARETLSSSLGSIRIGATGSVVFSRPIGYARVSTEGVLWTTRRTTEKGAPLTPNFRRYRDRLTRAIGWMVGLVKLTGSVRQRQPSPGATYFTMLSRT